MKVAFLILGLLLAGCDIRERRYEVVQGTKGMYLLDSKTGRVWQQHEVTGHFDPILITKDSGEMPLLKQSSKEFLMESFSYEPNSAK